MRSSLFGLLAFLGAGLHAQQRSALFVGNSYTYANDLPGATRLLALSLGDTLNVASNTPGGYTFEQHSTNATTLGLISSQPWDFVILQEQSQRPSFPPAQVEQEVYPFAAQLVDSVLANDSCTQPVFYMTWGRKNGDASNCGSWPPVCTYEGMQQRLRESYLEMAFANDAYAAPIGVAWKKVRETHPFIELYTADESHPSAEGTYLAGAVLYTTLYRRPSNASTYLAALHPDTAAILRSIASSTVLDSLGTWNIGVNDPDAGFDATTNTGGWTYEFVPNTMTGQHHWALDEGTTSDEVAPTLFMCSGNNSPHEGTVTHIVVDACGRTDTSIAVLPSCAEGVQDHGEVQVPTINVEDHRLTITGAMNGDELQVYAITGELLRTMRIGTAPMALPYPSALYIWRLISGDGRVVLGRFYLP